MVLCNKTGFRYNDTDKLHEYNITNFTCPLVKNYTVGGNYYTEIFSYIEMKLLKCSALDVGVKCADNATIDKYFTGNRLSFVFLNSYFDADNYTEPIQQFIDDSYYVQTVP